MSAPSNNAHKFLATAVLAALLALSGVPRLHAQEQQQDQAQQQEQRDQQPLSQQEIERLVAPIALYPDALVAQILTASTYPLEVVMAARWSGNNPNIKGAALEDAMQKQSWDPSVKGLTAVPQVLAMMSEKLEWTQQLGEAFLAQSDDVQNAIQTLRAKAEAAGNLKSGNEQKVTRVGPHEDIVIEPASPDVYYVPIYNPVLVFGAGFWPPAYVPFFWYPPWWTLGPVFGFGPAIVVGPALWFHYNWGYAGFAAISINATFYNRFNKVHLTGHHNWKFDPKHHRDHFKNPKLQKEFGKSKAGKGPGLEGKGLGGKGPGLEGKGLGGKGPGLEGKGAGKKGPTAEAKRHGGPSSAKRAHHGGGPSAKAAHRGGGHRAVAVHHGRGGRGGAAFHRGGGGRGGGGHGGGGRRGGGGGRKGH